MKNTTQKKTIPLPDFPAVRDTREDHAEARTESAFAKQLQHERLQKFVPTIPTVLYNRPSLQKVELVDQKFAMIPDLEEFTAVEYRLNQREGFVNPHWIFAYVNSGGGANAQVFEVGRNGKTTFLGHANRLGVRRLTEGRDE